MQFKIGAVVSLKSNGLLPLVSHDFLSLGGNENFTTPLMVVIEILNNISPEIDEETGEMKSTTKGGNKYKCMYFSNKAMKFEDNWFSENELEIYGNSDHEIHKKLSSSNLKWGDTVRFKTVDEESRKSKSYLENEKQKGIKSLITFASPAMQIIGFDTPDKKESLIDTYTGLKKRENSERLIKCKFFNTDSDKFSEQHVPVECLQKIDNTMIIQRMEDISNFIKAKSFIIVKTADSKYFGKPQAVHVFSGRYQLVFYNELLKKNELIWMDLITNFDKIDLFVGEYYPGINDGINKLFSVNEYIANEIKNLKEGHFKINYCNLKEQRVSRFITVKELSDGLNDNESIEIPKYYLKSFCHLREAERDFRSDRILSIRTIVDKKLNAFLKSKIK